MCKHLQYITEENFDLRNNVMKVSVHLRHVKTNNVTIEKKLHHFLKAYFYLKVILKL